ncbi:MAG: hypothetical protein Ct9H300mP20_06350 [Gammaproteobacteria bacterium]|nr:MAG: hypothetical protein Ct9H300mP20_06350 [Gammaproteobacteria bacterium]
MFFKNPQLADTLEIIAEKGRAGFYEGEVAKTIADFIQAQGGFLTYDDLANFNSEWVDPVSANYRGYDVWELPPNGQGVVALQILNILENFDLKEMGLFSSEYIHLFAEAKKLAFADRAKHYADPAFSEIPIKQLISKSYAKERAALIDKDKAALVDESGIPSGGDTIFFNCCRSIWKYGISNSKQLQGHGLWYGTSWTGIHASRQGRVI